MLLKNSDVLLNWHFILILILVKIMSDDANINNNDESACDCCPVCGCLQFIDRKLKRYCVTCGNLCETCCDGGKQ